MRSIVVGLIMMLYPVSQGLGQARFGFSLNDGQLDNFYLAIGNFYHVPAREVVVVRDYGLPEEDIPTVFFISSHSRYEPAVIARMRYEGDDWVDISDRCGIREDTYYVPSGPPYGNAWGYYRHRGWEKPYYLTDADIIRVAGRGFRHYDRYDRDDGNRWGHEKHHGKHGRWRDDD